MNELRRTTNEKLRLTMFGAIEDIEDARNRFTVGSFDVLGDLVGDMGVGLEEFHGIAERLTYTNMCFAEFLDELRKTATLLEYKSKTEDEQ